MDARDAFKLGFLARCAHEGLSESQTQARLKTAFEKTAILGTLIGKGADAATSITGQLLRFGLPLALLGPPIAGGLAGYGLAKATDVDDTDIADIKDKEVLDEYRRQTETLQRQRASRDYLMSRRQAGRMF